MENVIDTSPRFYAEAVSPTASLAHDIRNILSSAVLCIEGLERTESLENQAALVRLNRSINRTVQLCERTLQCEVKSSQNHNYERSLGDIITDVSALIHDLEADMSPMLRVNVDGTIFPRLRGDGLFRILVNLIENASHARRAMKKDGFRETRVLIALNGARDGSFYHLDVADNGPGFKVSCDGTQSRSTAEDSIHGLGLKACKNALIKEGGDLRLLSTGSSGTIWRITFPFSPKKTSS